MEDRKPKIELSIEDLEWFINYYIFRDLDINELMKIKASGLYILPEKYDRIIRNYIVDIRKNSLDDISDDILDIEDLDYIFGKKSH